MEKRLSVGAIGVGHLGRHHARLYAANPSARLVGVADTDFEQCSAIAKMNGTGSYSDYRELVDKVDAISIATPTVTHYEIARYCLSRGKHVLVEKPIASTITEAEELVSLAHKKNVVLQVGHLERFNAAVVELQRLIKQPGFIETQRLGSFSARSIDVDVILDLMIHDIDIVLSLVKSPIKNIHAVGVPVITDKVDIANARLIFTNGCVVNLTASRVSLEPTRKIRIFQRNLYISLDYATQNLFTCSMQRPPTDGATSFPVISKDTISITPVEPLKAEIDSFISCILQGTSPLVSGDDGLAALRVAFEIRNHMM